MASILYNTGKKQILDGTIDLANDTIKVALIGSGYTPDADHDDMADVNAEEVSDDPGSYQPGFSGSGRKTLANKSIGQDDANDKAFFDNTVDLVWSNLDNVTVRWAVIYKHDTGDASSILIACLDSADFPKTANGADFTLQFNTNGIFRF